jgi:hypothetical protein
MAEDGFSEILLPPGTEDVLGVFVNGVEKHAGSDYDVVAGRVRFTTPLRTHRSVSGFGKLLISFGVGVYDRGDIVDLTIRRGGRTQVVRGRPA